MNDDYRIWEDLKAGKEYALPKIYQHHIDFLFNYGKKFSKDENIILDAIQDVFLTIIQNHSHLGHTNNIRLYLLKALRRKLFRMLDKRRKFESIGDDMDQLIPEINFSIEEKLIRQEESDQKILYVREAMKNLTPQQKELLYYKFTCGFDYSEICELMPISYDAARKIISRSIQLLRQKLPVIIFVFSMAFFH